MLSNEQRLVLHCLSGQSLKVSFPMAAFQWAKFLISKSKAETVAIIRSSDAKPRLDLKSPFQETAPVSSSGPDGV